MKIKDIIKKVEEFNEIAEQIGYRKITLHFIIGAGYYEIPFEDIKSLKKNIKWHIVEPLAKAMIECEDYELNKKVEFEVVDMWGDTIKDCARFAVWAE